MNLNVLFHFCLKKKTFMYNLFQIWGRGDECVLWLSTNELAEQAAGVVHQGCQMVYFQT
jgi:hypothetical protein